ncbi:MAG: hypothetical protein ACI9BW_002614 [Gammaproteobacteria bacterium]|jgi:hypothetical protein
MNNSTVLTRQVIAHNDATDSGNPMHDDAAARAMNFKGALVPGITVFGYMTHSLVAHFGIEWLSNGYMQVRFRRPVYAGEELKIDSRLGDDNNDSLGIDVLNPDGEVCVLGNGSLTTEIASLPASFAPYRDLPEPQWPATHEQFEREKILGSLRATFSETENSAFLYAMQDDHAIYRDGTMHPSWLLRQANIVVDRNFDIGPWIHVESEIRNYATASVDEGIEVRAQVVALFERKGHQYFDLDIAMLIDGDPERLAMRVLHRAIYKMGATAKSHEATSIRR